MALTSARAKLQRRCICSYHNVLPTSHPYIQDSGAEDSDDASDEDEDEDDIPPPQMDVDPAVKPGIPVPGQNNTRPPQPTTNQGVHMSPNLPNELIGI